MKHFEYYFLKNRLVILAVTAGFLLLLLGFASKPPAKTGFEAARETIVMRQVAHKILLYSGDSTTPVLPVKRISDNEYQIPFKGSFSFKPDSLVSIIGAALAQSQLPADYVVQVAEPANHSVVFGYAIMASQQKSLVPCNGRIQPAKPYSITISFKENKSQGMNWLMGGGVALLVFGTATVFRKRNKQGLSPVAAALNDASVTTGYRIGHYLFDPADQTLTIHEQSVLLTDKENRLLVIFSEAPNKLIDRNRLQKEVWEDEGVIVGRSLDVFVSKLRKKLEGDPAVRIVSVHGKGYRLEVEQIPV